MSENHQQPRADIMSRRPCNGILINATRVGVTGGLRTFAAALISCFDGYRAPVTIVSNGFDFVSSFEQVGAPSWVGSSSRVSALRPILWWLYSLVLFPRKPGYGVLSTTHHVLPFCRRQIVTVHDIRPYFHPDNAIQKINFRYLLPRALKKCDAVLTVSETSKDLLTRVYGIDPSRIYVVPNMIDPEFLDVRRETCPAEPFLLSVGASWKHKNITELLEMHDTWSSHYTVKVVAGEGQYLDMLRALAKSLGIENRVEFIAGTSKQNLLKLYASCSALVYPSLMEGFGLPPLEAMALGVPTIVSDIRVFRELYRDIPIYVTLGDKRSWEEAINSLTTFPSERLDSGKQWAAAFSQERMRTALFHAVDQTWQVGLPQ